MALADGFPLLGLISRAIAVLAITLVLRFAYNLYRTRSLFRDLAKQYGIPMAPHSFLFGHLPVLGKLQTTYATDAYGAYVPVLLAREFPEVAAARVVYIDAWPFAYPMVAVLNPEMMGQYTQDVSLPKADLMAKQFMPFSGCNDLVNQEGQAWKTWRNVFNPGFSVKNLMALAPDMVEEIQVFRDWMSAAADSGDVVQLEQGAMRVTTDIIGRAALGERLHCQTSEPAFYHAFKKQVAWLVNDATPPNLLKQMDPRRPFAIWYNNRIMRNYLEPIIKRGISEFVQNGGKTDGPKTIISLAIKSYVEQVQLAKSSAGVDYTFMNMAVSQMKIFILAGQDTTASTLSFAYNLLYRNPKSLEAIRAEHDQVFGIDAGAVGKQLTSNPRLLNQLPYTSAVIKETLRLYPPINTVRQGQDDFFLVDPNTRQRFPTKGMMILGNSVGSHRDKLSWPRPDEFVPERWLAREGEPLHVRRNLWRPFELGPRNCIGQELAQMELRAILAMTLREFDLENVWSPDDPELFGDKAYPAAIPGEITPHVKKYLPVKIRRRKLNA